jgi:hypothetical protein
MINRRIVILTNGFNSASGGRRLFSKLLKILKKYSFFFSAGFVQPTRFSYFNEIVRRRQHVIFPVSPYLT